MPWHAKGPAAGLVFLLSPAVHPRSAHLEPAVEHPKQGHQEVGQQGHAQPQHQLQRAVPLHRACECLEGRGGPRQMARQYTGCSGSWRRRRRSRCRHPCSIMTRQEQDARYCVAGLVGVHACSPGLPGGHQAAATGHQARQDSCRRRSHCARLFKPAHCPLPEDNLIACKDRGAGEGLGLAAGSPLGAWRSAPAAAQIF